MPILIEPDVKCQINYKSNQIGPPPILMMHTLSDGVKYIVIYTFPFDVKSFGIHHRKFC